MFVFLTSVRHPQNSGYYETVWDLLRNTLFSVCSQSCDNYKVIVVCNTVLDDFSDIPRIRDKVEFVTVDFEPPTEKIGPTTGVPACNHDRGYKYVAGLVHAKQYDPEYVMFFDADDFVSKHIVKKTLKNPGQPGWTFTRGYFIQDSLISYRGRFNEMCGTSHILNFDMLTQDIRFDNLSINSSQIDISENVHPFFIKGVLGCHMNYETYFFNMHKPLKQWEDAGPAAYNMGTGENHSGKNATCGDGWFPLRRTKSKTLERIVRELTLPLVDHKNKRIGITIPDINCREAMKLAGLHNSAELTAKEYCDIYGDYIWDEYETIAYVRNPWERLVNLYHEHENRTKYSSFLEFVLSGKTKSQFSHLLVDFDFSVDAVRKSEDIENKKLYWGHYSEYYSDELHDFVSETYSKDIEEFGYSFEVQIRDDLTRPLGVGELVLSATILPRIEVFFLKEWIDHHLALGVDRVKLYNNGIIPVDNSIWAEGARPLTEEERQNNKWKKKPDADYFVEYSDEDIAELLIELVDEYNGSVEVIPWVYGVDHWIEYPYSQWEALKHCTEKEYGSWRLFIDPDEYMVLRLHDSLHDLMKDFPQSCLKFKQRIFGERKRDEPVRKIFNWGYDHALPKNLVTTELDYSEILDVHTAIPINKSICTVPTDVAVYHHYRGDPNALGGDLMKTVYNELGDPEFTKKDYSMKKYLLFNEE